eukprot:362231-Chlamydomonas_euryale.AAC.2
MPASSPHGSDCAGAGAEPWVSCVPPDTTPEHAHLYAAPHMAPATREPLSSFDDPCACALICYIQTTMSPFIRHATLHL